MPTSGCKDEGCSATKGEIAYAEQRYYYQNCQNGYEGGCPKYGEIAAFTAGGLVGVSALPTVIGGALTLGNEGLLYAGSICLANQACLNTLNYSLGIRNIAGVNNPIPDRMARVIPAKVLPDIKTLASPSQNDVFVAAADDIANISTSEILAQRLTLIKPNGDLIGGPFAVIEFDTPSIGVASPIFRTNPGFIGNGLTAGGAREFVIPNMQISDLLNLAIRIIQ